MKKVGYFFLGFVPLGLVYLLQLGLSFILVFLSQGIAMGIGHFQQTTFVDFIKSSTFNGAFGMCFAANCILIYGIWYYHFCGGDFKPNLKKTFNAPSVLGVIITAPGVQFISAILMMIMTVLFPVQIQEYAQLMEDAGLSNDINVFTACYAVLLAPIGEELIFRGVSMRCFRRAVPFWLANILQAILFGIFHGNLIQGVYTAIFALLLGFVCEYGGSIYYSILMHFAFNLWGVFASTLLSKLPAAFILMAEGFMFFALIGGVALFLVGQKKLHPNHHLK